MTTDYEPEDEPTAKLEDEATGLFLKTNGLKTTTLVVEEWKGVSGKSRNDPAWKGEGKEEAGKGLPILPTVESLKKKTFEKEKIQCPTFCKGTISPLPLVEREPIHICPRADARSSRACSVPHQADVDEFSTCLGSILIFAP